MLIDCLLTVILSAAVVKSAVTGRQDGGNFFDFVDEVSAMFPGIGTNFGDAGQYDLHSPKPDGNRFMSSAESGRFQKSKEEFDEQHRIQRNGGFINNRPENPRRNHGFRNDHKPRSHERVSSRPEEKYEGSNEVQSRFRSRHRHLQEPARESNSQERPKLSSEENDRNSNRDLSKESERQNFKPRDPNDTPASQERESSRSGEKNEETPNIRRRLRFRERTMATRPPTSQERVTSRSEETFLTDKDPAEIPTRQEYRELKPAEDLVSNERTTSRSEEAYLSEKDSTGTQETIPRNSQENSARHSDSTFLTDNEDNSNNRNRPIERPHEVDDTQQADQEQSLARTGETFLTDDEDNVYFPEQQNQYYLASNPTRNTNKETTRSEDTFLTDKDDISNMIISPNRRKPIDRKEPSQSEERLPPQSGETGGEDFPVRKPDNLNLVNSPHEQPEHLSQRNDRFRSHSSHENKVANNFISDDEHNPLAAPEGMEPTPSPKHLGRVRWPPPKRIEESPDSEDKPHLAVEPLFYGDTFGIIPNVRADSVEAEDESEDQARNRIDTKRIRKPTTAANSKKPSRKQGSESEENGSSEDEPDEGGQSPSSDESKEDHPAHESHEAEDDFPILSGDDGESEEENHDIGDLPVLDNDEPEGDGEGDPEGNQHDEEPHEEEHVEDSDESPLAYNNPKESPPNHDSEEAPLEQSGEAAPESSHESEESFPEISSDSNEALPENGHESGEENGHGSDEHPSENGNEAEGESDESPPEEHPESEETPPEEADGSEESPPEEEHSSEDSPPEGDHDSEESPPQESHASEEEASDPSEESEESSPEETPPEENSTSEEFPAVSNSDESLPNNVIESEEHPPEQNGFSSDELFPHDSTEGKPGAEHENTTPNNNGDHSSGFGNKKRKPGSGKKRPYFGGNGTPFSGLFEDTHPQEEEKPEIDFEDIVKSNEEPDFPQIPKINPNYEDNKLKPPSGSKKDKKKPTANGNSGDDNSSPEINLDSFEFEDFDVLEAPPSSGLGTTSKPTTTKRPTSLPENCVDGDEDSTTPHPIDLLKAKRPIKTVKPQRRPGDEVSIAISGPKAVRVKTTKGTTTTTTPKPVTISAIGVIKPGGEIIAKMVNPTVSSSAAPQNKTTQRGSANRRTTTPSKKDHWKTVLAAREATALTYLKPPAIGQPQTWLMTPPPPSPMFRLFVV